MSPPLHLLARPEPERIPADPAAFLAQLPGPCAFHVPGRDHTRHRVVTTLLHGNEPSGLRAIHAWLRSGARPACDAVLVVANVPAARSAPLFGHRSRPGGRDLNRCFLGPFDDAEGRLARAILERVREAPTEALIDIHNNTGHNPPYGVGVHASPEALQLVALFGERFVLSHLRLGALMEAVPELPSATIEVGRSGDPAADAIALRGLTHFLERDPVIEPGKRPEIALLLHPMRVCIRAGVSLAVGDVPQPDAELTIRGDLDRHNFESIAPGTPLGWVRGSQWPLELLDEEAVDRAPLYFELADGEIRARRAMIPIMITTSPAIATSDCLFYIVREA